MIFFFFYVSLNNLRERLRDGLSSDYEASRIKI